MTQIRAEADSNRPYPPPTTCIALLNRFRSRNLPEHIDSEYLRDAGVTDSLNARVLYALRFLKLIDEGIPTSTLRSIARSTDEEYRSILAAVLRDCYRDVFEMHDPAQDPQNQFVNFFRRYSPASQRDRMVVFFLGMCREAGLATVDAPRNRTSGVAANAKTSSAKKPKSTPVSVAPANSRAALANRNDQQQSTRTIPAGLELLVQSLPPAGAPMSDEKREQWLMFARAALDYIYPRPGRTSSNSQSEDDEEEDGEE